MKNTKKIILIILVIFCAIITGVAFLLGENVNNNNNNSNNNITNSNNNKNYEISKNITKVNDYEEFFSIQNTINDNVEMTESFYALEIYTNSDSKLNYYFIKGKLIEVLMDDETTSYENANYLLILDRNTNMYMLNKLSDNIADLENYAKNYNINYININGEKRLKNGTDKIDVILSSYIEYYKNLIAFDTEVAYNMLTDNTKAKYYSYENFSSKKYDIYNNISSNVYGYNIEEKEGYNIYNVNDKNFRKITIYEYNVMDFKIEF